MRATNTGSRVGVAGWPVRWRAAAMARWRTASGLRAGMPRPWRAKALRSDGQVVPSSAAAALTLPSCSARAKARSASARSVRKRLGCQPSRRSGNGRLPLGEGGGEGVAVDAELFGGLPHPDLAGELVRGLGQVAALPVGAGLGEAVAAQPAAFGRQGAAEDAVIVVEPTSGVDGQIAAVVADLAAGADGLGLGRLDPLARFGEEPLGVQVTAGGLVQPSLPAVVLDHHRRPLRSVDGGGGVAVGGAQGAEHLPDSALADPDQPGDVGGGEPLAAFGLPQPPQLLDPLRVGEGAAPQRDQGTAHIVLAHPDLPRHGCRVQVLAAGDLTGLVELLDPLQRPVCRPTVLDLGSAAVGIGSLQGGELLGRLGGRG